MDRITEYQTAGFSLCRIQFFVRPIVSSGNGVFSAPVARGFSQAEKGAPVFGIQTTGNKKEAFRAFLDNPDAYHEELLLEIVSASEKKPVRPLGKHAAG